MNTLKMALSNAAKKSPLALLCSIVTLLVCLWVFDLYIDSLKPLFLDNNVAFVIKTALLCGLILVIAVACGLASAVFLFIVADEYKTQVKYTHELVNHKLDKLAKEWETSTGKSKDGRSERLELQDYLTILHFEAGYSIAKLQGLLREAGHDFHLFVAKDTDDNACVKFASNRA